MKKQLRYLHIFENDSRGITSKKVSKSIKYVIKHINEGTFDIKNEKDLYHYYTIDHYIDKMYHSTNKKTSEYGKLISDDFFNMLNPKLANKSNKKTSSLVKKN